MKPSYSSDFDKKSSFFIGRSQKTLRTFTLWGIRSCIPAVYRYKEGIVFDLFTFPEEEKVRNFYKAYAGKEDSFSPAPLRRLEGEHPCPNILPCTIRINGIPAAQWDSQNFLHMPWAPENENLKRVLEKTYGNFIKRESCFSCQRFRVTFPDPLIKTGVLGALFPSRVVSLSLEFPSREIFFPLELEFTVSEREGSGRYTEISFRHPETQILHTLYLQKEELERLPGDTPLWVTPILYEIRPPLSSGEELCFDSSISIPQTGDGFGFSPEATGSASIGIIGGADGPTAIFTGGLDTKELPRGAHGGSLHYTFAKPSRQPETKANVFLLGISQQKGKKETIHVL